MFMRTYTQNVALLSQKHHWNILTMKDALVLFCGCLQMRNVLSSTMKARMQTTARLHASIRDRASMAWLMVTHSATTNATAEKEKMYERGQFVDLRDKEICGQQMVLECLRNKKPQVLQLCLPCVPVIIVKVVTLLEVDELGDDGGFRKPNLVFGSLICRSVSLDGPSWYLDWKKKSVSHTLSFAQYSR